ncbi:MAG: biopolymer transporter ExbD [Verrucomicrobiae bacterium]|nr:biopolymer transporter ExbD [Verrucomicrobiae bacterium]
MSFYPRRRRSAPAIIIISLIDVLLVMLVFLLFTTTLRSTPAVSLELPESSQSPRAGASAEKPPLVLSIRREAPRFFLGERTLEPGRILAELQAAREADPAVRLVLRADREAEWGDVVRVLDFAKQAAITNVKAFTKGPDAKR